jgi:16S rRNA (uracil1498-N3)-methyltransferase
MQRYFAINKNLEISRDDIHHIINVMKMKLNDNIEIIYDNTLFLCNIDFISKKEVKYSVVSKKELKSNKTYKVILACSLIKNFDYMLQKATELGVDEIIPVISNRSVIKVTDEPKKINRWQKICKEASEQSHRNNIPIIHNVTDIKELKLYKQNVNILCSVNNSTTTIKEVMHKTNIHDKILVVIGPEGGFTTSEEEYLINNEFISTSLGDNVMKAETVPLYILSVINYNFMR